MKKWWKRLALGAGAILTLVLLLVGWIQITWSLDHPDTPIPQISATDDPQMIARGEYLVHAVAHCSTCHGSSTSDEARFDASRPLRGGYVWDLGPFGVYTAANITPHETGIGGMTDGEIARVVRTGIGRGGTLSPMMRFSVGPMADEDLVAILSWLRAQQPVEGEQNGPRFGFLAKALSSRFEPRLDPAPAWVDPGETSAARGSYLANGPANCAGCHTPMNPLAGFAPSGPAFSGAAEADPDPTDPRYEIVAPNLTPHSTGVLAGWTEDAFVARFRTGRSIEGSSMPWEAFQLLTEGDVRSLYRYLRSLDPVDHDPGPSRRLKGSFRG
jgi:mono/diheme cytochrome c family protein